MSDFPVILENTDKIDKRPEVVAAMAAWGTVLTCKQLQLQLGKSRAALGKYMPVHLNMVQQLRIARSALLELVGDAKLAVFVGLVWKLLAVIDREDGVDQSSVVLGEILDVLNLFH